jgi:hypothetical protein
MKLTKILSQPIGQITGEKSTITTGADTTGSLAGKSFKFYLKNEAGTEQGFWVYFVVTGYTSANPVTGSFLGIPVTIAAGTTAANVGAALRAALKANSAITLLARITGATTSCVIEGRWPYDTTNIADVDTGWTIVTSTAGSTTVVYDMTVAAAANFVYQPKRTELAYLRRIILSVSDSAVTAGGSFGALAALTNGIYFAVVDVNLTSIVSITPVMKTNAQTIQSGRSMILGTTMYTVEYNLVEMFGGEVPIDGSLGQTLICVVGDATTGLDGMFATTFGHYTQSLD